MAFLSVSGAGGGQQAVPWPSAHSWFASDCIFLILLL